MPVTLPPKQGTPTARPAAGGKAKPKLGFTSSKDLPFWAAFRGNVLSAPGMGKSHLLWTASKNYTGWPPEPGTVYDDVIVVETDSLGLGALEEAGAEIPHVIDLTMYNDAEIDAVKFEIPRLIKAKVAECPHVRLVGMDTASVFWAAILSRKQDGPRGYIDLAADVRRFFWELRKVAVPIISNCHLKDPSFMMQDRTNPGRDPVAIHEAKQVAAGASTGQDALNMDMPGRDAAKALRNHGTFTWFLEKRELPGGGAERILNCNDRRVETKKRLSLAVGDKEPAHLGKLFQKIAEKCSAPLPGAEIEV